MKIAAILLLTILSVQTTYARKQPPVVVNPYAAVDQKAKLIPDSVTRSSEMIAKYVNENFQTSTDKVRAIFVWMGWNIEYDIDNMFSINFYEKKEDIIAKPLLTRKGICSNYAELFADICSKAAIRAFVVVGYTKQNGFADYIPHAWCAALIDSSWYMFDPTWGSGYCSNGRFYRQINDEYFKASPDAFVKSHMPFDPLWQFLDYTVTNQEFYDGYIQPASAKKHFNFADSLTAYEKADTLTKLYASAERTMQTGSKTQ